MAKLEEKLSGEGEDKMTIEDDMVVVIMVLDNSLYFVEDEDGGRHQPQRSGDGKYHIDGQLKLATGRQATKVMEKFLPILRRLKKNRKLILVPSPRFASARPAAWTEEPTAPTGRRGGSSRACCPG